MGGDAIKKVRIKGFQALADVKLDLSPGVNVIVGPSDSGKSSLVRALRSATQQAEGASFVREGAKKAVVGLEMEDGTRVVWEKGKGVNKYSLDGEKFSRVGRSVPEPVVEALRIAPVKFGEGAERLLQFSEQGEPAFMIADAPAECARLLGGVSGAAVVADAVRRAAKTTSNLSRDVKTAEREADTSKEALAVFAGLDEERASLDLFVAAIGELSSRADEWSVAEASLVEFTADTMSSFNAQKEGEDASAAASRFDGLDETEDRLTEVLAVVDAVVRSTEVRDDASGAAVEAALARESLGYFEGLVDLIDSADGLAGAIGALARHKDARQIEHDSGEALHAATLACGAVSELDAVGERLSGLGLALPVLLSYNSAVVDADLAASTRSKTKDEFDRAQDEIGAFIRDNPSCPLCGAPLEGV